MQVFIYHLSHYELAIQESTDLDKWPKTRRRVRIYFYTIAQRVKFLAEQFLSPEVISGPPMGVYEMEIQRIFGMTIIYARTLHDNHYIS